MNQTEPNIRDFWNSNLPGERTTDSKFAAEAERFFAEYDKQRYTVEGHILGCLDAIEWRDKDTLEIGLGQGADSEQLIRRGARWSGLDLTPEAVTRVRTRLQLRNLPFADIREGSIVDPPYAPASFDIIYSHGVLHHVPDIKAASAQITKMLRPGGELIVMLYAKWSLHYLVSISLYYRALISAAYLMRKSGGTAGRQFPFIRQAGGLLPYLRMKNFLHHNTDYAENPYTKVYDVREVARDFPEFRVVKAYKRFLTCEPLPISGRGNILGWHLWAHLKAAS